MSGRDRNIEDLFREKLSGTEVVPGSNLRQSLFRKVAAREFFRFNPARINIYYSVGAAALITASLVLSTSRNDRVPSEEPYTNPSGGMIKDTVKIRYSDPIRDTGNNSRGEISRETVTRSEAVDKDREDIITRINPQTGSDTIMKMDPAGRFAGLQNEVKVRSNPSASFSLPVNEGCVPLRIKIRNTSAPFDSCTWSFGDNSTSRVNEPEWIFEKPGTYMVTLKVYGNNGQSSSYSDQVKVYSGPEARFEIVPVDDGSDFNAVRFVNYSAGAVRYSWDFGDGSSSTLMEPIHRYMRNGNFTVRLTAWSDKGCAGASEQVYAAGSNNFYINFPNAFMPNRTGPTGGQYTAASDASAHIFHPEAAGVVEYQLRIYTRTGMLLFESADINTGWDGYHKGNLCEPGVYVWRASGKFKNGESFSKMGDITIIRANN